jgi:hypothetical protein
MSCVLYNIHALCIAIASSECYGRGSTGYTKPYRCWACLAVGKTVKGRTLHGQRCDVAVTQRPTACCLCSIDLKDKPLAVHPLFDNHGWKGRQIYFEFTRLSLVVTFQPRGQFTLLIKKETTLIRMDPRMIRMT